MSPSTFKDGENKVVLFFHFMLNWASYRHCFYFWPLISKIKSSKSRKWNLESGITIGEWNWRLRLEIGNLDWGFELGIRIEDRVLGLEIGLTLTLFYFLLMTFYFLLFTFYFLPFIFHFSFFTFYFSLFTF